MNRESPSPALCADALLRDAAFVLRMARKISNEIKSENKNQGTYVPRSPVRLTDPGQPVTLGA